MAGTQDRRHDKRALYSRALLKESLLSLMHERPFASVSVAALAERAGVSRSTFYHHYADTAELLGDVIDDSIAEMKAVFRALGIAVPGGSGLISVPLCQYIRKSVRYRPLFSDQGIEHAVIAKLVEESRGGFTSDMAALHGLSSLQAEAVARFEAAGYLCFCRAYAHLPEQEWQEALRGVDKMVRRGLGTGEGGAA